MDEEKLNDIQHRLETIEEAKKQKDTQQISLPLDEASVRIINDIIPTVVAVSLTGITRFGGTGADGALTVTSGTTTINLNSAKLVIKNYSSISITGTGVLAFSNPNSSGTCIIFKCSGDVTFTSSANPTNDLRDLGGVGGAAATGNSGVSGTAGSSTLSLVGGGTLGTNSNPTGLGGAGGVAPLNGSGYSATVYHAVFIGCGGGGASGGASTGTGNGGGGGGGGASLFSNGTAGGDGPAGGGANAGNSGAGGRGAGALLIECAGAYNCSAIFNAAGTDATTPTGATGSNGGGGGGGGGTIVVLYGTLTADTGTYTVTGGARTQGIHMGANKGDGGAGAAGASLVAAFNV